MFCTTSSIPLRFSFSQTGLPTVFQTWSFSFPLPHCLWCFPCQINPSPFSLSTSSHLSRRLSLTLANSHLFLHTHRWYCLITPLAFYPIVSNMFFHNVSLMSAVCCTVNNQCHIYPSGISSVLPTNGCSGVLVPCIFYMSQLTVLCCNKHCPWVHQPAINYGPVYYSVPYHKFLTY